MCAGMIELKMFMVECDIVGEGTVHVNEELPAYLRVMLGVVITAGIYVKVIVAA